MKAGIVGLPNVGKSTVFNCLSNARAQSANYPFCTIEPNIGMVNVPDERLDKLNELVKPQRVVPATLEIVDIAGLIKGASKGEGLGNQFLANIRETDAILHVLRCFDDDNIIHEMGNVDPLRDKEVVETELQLKDLETLEKRLDKVARQAKVGMAEAKKELEVLQKLKTDLERGISVRMMDFEGDTYDKYIKPLQLLTAKPVMYVCNVDEQALRQGGNAYTEQVMEMAAKEGAEAFAENMEALKHNWLFKKYFEERGYWKKSEFELNLEKKIENLYIQQAKLDEKIKQLKELEKELNQKTNE